LAAKDDPQITQIFADREAESSKLKAKKVSRKGAKTQRKKPKAEPG